MRIKKMEKMYGRGDNSLSEISLNEKRG
jgi:hypothetical protein